MLNITLFISESMQFANNIVILHSKEYNLYGKDKVIKGGKGFAQGIWSYARRSGYEVWRRLVLCTQSGTGKADVKNG